jgi:hypothetical protein
MHVHRFGTFTYRIWGIHKLLHILLEVCTACKDKVEIKCTDSVGGKTPTELKFYLFFSNLEHMEHVKVDVMRFVPL